MMKLHKWIIVGTENTKMAINQWIFADNELKFDAVVAEVHENRRI